MICKCLPHLYIIHIFPSSRNILLTRISPPVAIMEIYHQRHPPVFSTFGHLDDIFLITEPILRIYPYAQTDSIKS